MSRAWYIDAIDPRGGYAFASHRDGDLLTTARLHSGPSVFIAPPSFQPEPIINTGLAAGAARRGSQEGLFLERGEVPFDTAETAAEFVRRAYMAASSDDNGGDGGQELPPDPPEPPPLPEGLAEVLQAVRGRVSQFERQVDENQSIGRSSRFDWFGGNECQPQDISDLVSYGLAWVLHLLAPGIPNDWEVLDFSEYKGAQTVIVALRCERTLRNFLGVALNGGRRSVVIRRWSEILFDPHVHPWGSTDVGDPIDTLVRVPLSLSMSRQLGLSPRSANLYNLLLRVVASPAVLLSGTETEFKRLAAMTTLAGAVVVSRQELPPSSGHARPDHYQRSAKLVSRWLREQLPSRAFHRSVESLITTPRR